MYGSPSVLVKCSVFKQPGITPRLASWLGRYGMPSAVLRCPGSFRPVLPKSLPSPSLGCPLSSRQLPPVPREGIFKSKGPPGEGGQNPPACCHFAALHATLHPFPSPKALTSGKRMKGGDTFVNKILWRKPEPNTEQTRLCLYPAFS